MNDFNEEELEQQQADADLQKMEAAMQRRQAKQAQAHQLHVQNEAFNEGLKESGLSPEEFQQILNSDPAGATQEFKAGIKRYIGNVAKRKRDPQTGRFTPGPASDAKWDVQKKPGLMTGNTARYQPSREVREQAKSGNNEAAVNAMISDIVDSF